MKLILVSAESGCNEKEIIEYAINVDKQILKIYRRLEEKFTSEWKIRKLQLMEAEKIQRVMKLQTMLTRV